MKIEKSKKKHAYRVIKNFKYNGFIGFAGDKIKISDKKTQEFLLKNNLIK